MADSNIDITAGTGTSIDTRTEGTNGHHRQVIVVGDPATNAGVAPVDATAGLKVDLGADNDVTVTGTVDLGATDNAVLDSIDTAVNGTLTVSGTVTANLGATDNAVLDSIDTAVNGTLTVDLGSNNDVQGDVAHDSADSGNPLKIGAKATNSIEGVTQVANADRTNIVADLNGVLITRPHTTLEEILSERVSDTGGTSTAFTTFGAGGAGVHNYVTTIVVHNASATDGYVDIRDGSAGSVLMTIPAPTTGGAVINLPVPLKSSANTALAYDVSGALTTVYITLVGFQAQG